MKSVRFSDARGRASPSIRVVKEWPCFGMTSSFPSYSLTTLGSKKPGQVRSDFSVARLAVRKYPPDDQGYFRGGFR